MTFELVVVAVLVAAGGWAYVHFSGKSFDRQFKQSDGLSAPDNSKTAEG